MLWNEAGASHIGYAVKPSERKKGYGTEMLRLGLLKAKKIGIKKVIMNCNIDNLPSKKIIEKNGGRAMPRIKEGGEFKLRFQINNK